MRSCCVDRIRELTDIATGPIDGTIIALNRRIDGSAYADCIVRYSDHAKRIGEISAKARTEIIRVWIENSARCAKCGNSC